MAGKPRVFGYMPDDTPPPGALLSLGFQQALTMFPATVLVATLTKFDVGVTILASGAGHARRPAGLEAADEPRHLAVGATILICGIGGNLALKDGLFPFPIPVVFPNGIPAIVFSAIAGILLNLLFVTVKRSGSA